MNSFERADVAHHPSGAMSVKGVLVTPEDAVRMLLRTMGEDPAKECYREIPARVVRRLHYLRDGKAQHEGEELVSTLLDAKYDLL